MIKQPAKVIAETDSAYLLETLPQSACPKCETGQGCGGGILAKAFGNKTYRVSINKDKQLKINEFVQIGIQPSVLVQGSMLLYLLPLLLMVTAALFAGSLTEYQDIYTVSAAVIGFISGIVLARVLSRRYFNDQSTKPVLIDDEADACWYQAE